MSNLGSGHSQVWSSNSQVFSRTQNGNNMVDVQNRISNDTHEKHFNENRESISSDDSSENEASSLDKENYASQSKENNEDKTYTESIRKTSVKHLANRFSTNSTDEKDEVHKHNLVL